MQKGRFIFLLYLGGLSYRNTAYNISYVYVDVSHEAVRKQVRRIEKCIKVKIQQKHRYIVAVDQTMMFNFLYGMP